MPAWIWFIIGVIVGMILYDATIYILIKEDILMPCGGSKKKRK